MNLNEEIQSVKQRFGIIGNAPVLNHAIQVAIQVAPTDMTVLITGESGSGKESFSKIIHSLSSRKHGQFIAINCGAIPEGTIDSELFGHEKGSFTGAHEARKGYFEVTNGGTIFLDEIGEMPVGTQARLLRVLENGEFIKVGSSKVQKTNVRVVAATNVDLYQAVEKGKFREDLYYRLNTVPIFVPPLRDREGDKELLFRKFAADFADKYKVQPIRLNDEAKVALNNFRFPGNIRQLKNIVEQVSVLETNRDITKETLLKYLPEPHSGIPAVYNKDKNKTDDFSERDILYKILFDMKKDMTELKKLVFDLLQNENYGSQMIKDHPDLFTGITEEIYPREQRPAKFLLPPPPEEHIHEHAPIEIEKIEDAIQESEEESLSLEDKEKEMILKALKRNHNKRKNAARDLGISERTLYRKLKQYEIEE
ncbi:MAG: sigma-54-dependent Fis family transcriptional regulator [Sporocytophaga sp.]|uniref:sigma-54 interaction domain-containing protein n=1 Tax=Sporocytophaga sp. TaxID=2231183 RepID=UPI001B2577A0|nr:sigma-54 dependent transcriptional regulator [Sporocytophaga sp.]MBO9699114.1 sigma-54-dependent Fis family transcriptional regulator [Sporocytophaga sp.]